MAEVPRGASFLPQINAVELLPRITKVYFSSQVGNWKGAPKSFNQDYYFDVTKEQSRLLGVCDGYGQQGHEVAKFTAEKLPAVLYRHTIQKQAISTGTVFTASFAKCSKLLQESAIDTSSSGAACLALLQVGKTILCASVGDSRAVVGRKMRGIWTVYQLSWGEDSREKAVGLNKQQPSLVQFYLKRNSAVSTPQSLLPVSNSSSSPDIEVFTLSSVDKFVLIATRGLWEVMDSIEAVRLVGALYETQAEAVPEMLVREAQRRWKERGHLVEDVTVGLAVISP